MTARKARCDLEHNAEAAVVCPFVVGRAEQVSGRGVEAGYAGPVAPRAAGEAMEYVEGPLATGKR